MVGGVRTNGNSSAARVLAARVLAARVAAALITAVAVVATLSSTAWASSNVDWGAGQEAQLPAGALTSSQSAVVSAVSCPTDGNCTGVGQYTDSSSALQGLLLSQTSGTWGTGTEASLPQDANANPSVTLDSVSCASAGNCTAVGYYNGSSGLEGLLLTETAGSWGIGVEAALPNDAGPSPSVVLTSVSCPSAGDCTAVGRYTDSSNRTQGLLLTEASGTWAQGVKAPLPGSASASPGVTLSAVSCSSVGNCTVVGNFTDSSNTVQGLLTTETSGSWGTAVKAALPDDGNSRPVVSLSSVSCGSAGNCAAVGNYLDGSGNYQGLLLTESGGTWTTGARASLPPNASQSPIVSLPSVDCPSVGDCTAVGSYSGSSNGPQGLLLTESSGSWAAGVQAPMPGNAGSSPNVSLPSVSCASAGNCSAVGQYMDSTSSYQGLLLTETSGTWAGAAEATPPSGAASTPEALVDAVSCSSAGICSAGGYYEDNTDSFQGLLLTAPPTGLGLSLSAPSTGNLGTPISSFSVPATLAGGAAPTGTIAFTLFGPQASPPTSCTTGGTTVGTATVSGNGSYYSGATFNPSATGTYWWFASYGGDTGDSPATSTCGVGMPSTVISKAATTLTTSAPSTDDLGTGVHPAGLLSGATGGAGGTITFTVFGPQSTAPSSCTSGGTTLGTDVTVSSNGNYVPGSDFTPVTPGIYWWYASYSGDSTDASSASTCGVGMASTDVTNATTLTGFGPATGTVGTAIDASSLTGVLAGATGGAGGTITFTVFGPQTSAPSTCTSGGTTVGTATVSGNGTYNPSAGFTPAAGGTYWWYASYGGDSSDAQSGTICGAGMASTVVSKLATSLSTAAPGTGTVASPIAANSISAALSGAASDAGGTITFTVFGPQSTAPSSCTSGGNTVDTVPVSSNATYNPTVAFSPAAGGTYWWYASYSGDSTDASSASTCGVGMASTDVTNATTLTGFGPATGTVGTAIDASSLTGVLAGATGGAGGTITFTVFGPQTSAPSTCTSGGTTVGTATVSGNGTYNPSAGFTPAAGGTYWWYASYGGDSSDAQSGTICGAGMASTVVSKLATSLSTAAPGTGTVASPIAANSISAALSGAASDAGGTITFTVFGPQSTAPSSCTSGGNTVDTVPVSSNATYNPTVAFSPAAGGTYWWYASYSGDGGSTASHSICGQGMATTVVSKLATAVSAAAPSTGSSGTPIPTSSVSSVLSGATNTAGGMITFTVFGPQSSPPTSCAIGGQTVGTATVSGDKRYNPTAGFTATAAGTYWWYASYGGDAGNTASSSTCGAGMATTVVSKLTTALSAAAPSTGSAGTPIPTSSVSSVLSGATNTAGGMITFTVFGPQATPPTSCATGGQTVGTATVSGDKRYNPSASFTTTAAGTYWWHTSYGGDAANTPSASPCGATMPSTKVVMPRPVLSKLKQTQTRWQAGSKLATIFESKRPVSRTPIGTTFTFTLNEPAKVTLAFTHLVRGHKVAAGTLSLAGHAGNDLVAFQGLLSRTQRLAPGSYTVTFTATNTARQSSAPQRLSFTIVS